MLEGDVIVIQLILLADFEFNTRQVSREQLFPIADSRIVLATAGRDKLTQLRADSILRREALKANWVIKKTVRGEPTFYLEAARSEDAYSIQRLLFRDRELNCTSLALAVPSEGNLYFSFPSHAVLMSTSSLPLDLIVCGVQVGHSAKVIKGDALFKREIIHRSIQRIAFSLRRSGREISDKVDALDVFLELKSAGKRSSVLRFQFLGKRLLGSEAISDFPIFNAK